MEEMPESQICRRSLQEMLRGRDSKPALSTGTAMPARRKHCSPLPRGSSSPRSGISSLQQHQRLLKPTEQLSAATPTWEHHNTALMTSPEPGWCCASILQREAPKGCCRDRGMFQTGSLWELTVSFPLSCPFSSPSFYPHLHIKDKMGRMQLHCAPPPAKR